MTIKNSFGGEIIVPKIPSYRIIDLAKAISPSAKIKILGIRPGEKIHEEMISEFESGEILEFRKLYIIRKIETNKKYNYSGFGSYKKIKSFKYSSDINNNFLSINAIKKLLSKNLKLFEF